MATFNDTFLENGWNETSLLDHKGEALVCLDVKNRESLQSIDATIKKLISKSLNPVENIITLSPEIRSLPNGNKFAIISATLGETVGLFDGDNEILGNFLDYIERSNEYVLNKWEENNVQRISKEERELVGSIVDVQEIE